MRVVNKLKGNFLHSLVALLVVLWSGMAFGALTGPATGRVVLENISALLSISTPAQSMLYEVKGYHEAGDGGGGVFYWDATASKTGHNGGTIIDPDITFPTDWTDTAQQTTWFTAAASGTGAWKRVVGDYLSVSFFGAVGDGATNDLLPLNTTIDAATPSASSAFWATTGGRTVTLPAGVYSIDGEVYVPAWVNLRGEGAGLTVLKLTDAGARVRFGTWASGTFGTVQRGGTSGGFSIDGTDTATNGLIVGFVVEREFEDINVVDAAGDGIVVQAAQNCNFYGVHAQHNGASGSGSNLVFDYGAGNNRFWGPEINRGAEYNVKFVQSGSSPSGAFSSPTNNRIYGGMIERADDETVFGATIYHGAGRFNRFVDCDISLTGLTTANSIVKVRKDGTEASTSLRFQNCTFSGTSSYTTVFDLADTVSMSLIGLTLVENHAKVFAVDGTGVTVEIDRVFDSSGGTWWTGTTGAVEAQTILRQTNDTIHRYYRSAATEDFIRGYVDGDGYATPRFSVRADGRLQWGDGATSQDVTLYRNAANQLKTDDTLLVGGSLGVAGGVTASAVGALVTVVPLYNASGTLYGYVPVYNGYTP